MNRIDDAARTLFAVPSPTPRSMDEGEEIGGTKGKTHVDLLTQQLGRERGLRVATGQSQWEPIVTE